MACAIAEDGALVISCWAHLLNGDEPQMYRDELSSWKGNVAGSNLVKTHIQQAIADELPVRMVVATTPDPEAVDSGHDASKVKKTFHIRDDLVGRVSSFDGDTYVIEFRRKP